MKPVNLTPKLNKTHKKLKTFLTTFFFDEECKNDEIDVLGYIDKVFMQLDKDTKELICFQQDIHS